MAVSENSLDERGWPLNPALLPELKAAFRVKSCVVNGNAKEESQTIVRVHPKPKPRVCSMDASTANHFIKKQSTGDDKRRNIKSEAGKFKPVPAPRRNVPKVRQRQVSISASSMERSIEGPSIANTAIKMRTSTVNNSDSPWEDEEPDMVCTEKTQSLKSQSFILKYKLLSSFFLPLTVFSVVNCALIYRVIVPVFRKTTEGVTINQNKVSGVWSLSD
jgi:hypothetical protein